MENLSKLRHDHLFSQKATLQKFPSLLILDHLEMLAIFFLTLFESLLIFLRYDLYSHTIPILCIFSYFIYKYFFRIRPSNIFLVDYSCFKAPNFCRIPLSSFIEHVHIINTFDQESANLMSKILKSSGQGPETYLPPSLHYIPPQNNHYNSIEEAKMVLYPMMEDLIIKTNLCPQDIDILIVNCSGFCPSPCLTSLIVNKFKLKPNIKSFNLSGQGCSASVMALGLAQNLLLVYRESNVVILSAEILTTGWYSGNEQTKLVLNSVFRMGGAALLVSNRKKAQNESKYKLIWTSRVLRSFDDMAYKSAFREEDSKGRTGVTLNKNILAEASDLIRAQMVALGSFMLPIREKLKFGISFVKNKCNKKSNELYVPNFKTIITHFCLPVTGKPLIRELGRGLMLEEKDMEAAFATLHRFGNQSSTSVWYELAYLEAKDKVKKGDRILLLGMGSGPKCASAVIECIRPIVGESKKGPWAVCIDKYPNLAVTNSTPI